MARDLNQVKVSIVIPAYNVSEYIERCIQSVVNQTLKEIEIIVVNDGSKDNTLSLIKQFSSDPRLVIIDQANGGLPRARNVGIQKASGEYIFNLDGDDWIEANAFSELYEKAVSADADIVLSHAYVDDDKGGISFLKGYDQLTGDHLKDIFLGNISASVWTKLYRRSLFIDNNILFNEKFTLGEDLFGNINLFYYAKKITTLEKAYLHYIQRDTSITKTYNHKMLEAFVLMSSINDFLNAKKIADRYHLESEYVDFLHTYYYRVMVDVKNSEIHKEFHSKAQPKMTSYLKNPFISKFLKELKRGEKQAFWLFQQNYYLGKLKFLLYRYKRMLA